jgi:hypothetical protein
MSGNGNGSIGHELDPDDILKVAEQLEDAGVIEQLAYRDEDDEREFSFVIPTTAIPYIDKGDYTFDKSHMAAFLTGCLAQKEAE